MAKWACELGAFDIEFRARTAIKSQALVDFVAEWTEQQVPPNPEKPEHWKIYFDGSLKLEGAGAGVLFISPTGQQLKYVLHILFQVSNNAAEYEALLHGIRIIVSLGIQYLMVYGDSSVVINQVNKDWNCTSEKVNAYCVEMRKQEGKFRGIEFHHVARDFNVAADVLSKIASSRASVPVGIFIQEISKPSIEESEMVFSATLRKG